MNTKKNIFKNTIIFIISFIIATFLFIMSLGLLLNQSNIENYASKYFPNDEYLDDKKMNWDEIGKIGGSGFVIDKGKMVRSYNKDYKDSYTEDELLDLITNRDDHITTTVYDTVDDKKLFLIYDNKAINTTIQIDLNVEGAPLKKEIIGIIILVIVLYFLILYLIVSWLSMRINKEIEEIYRLEEREKDLLFKGIAHDVKTPLAVIISYSKAINDDMIGADTKETYIKTIEKNAHILNDRVDDLLDFASLSDPNQRKEDKDILEIIRRYVGDNYMYYMDMGGKIEILFDEDEKYITSVDEKLFIRVLQNILSNSIDHSETDVDIYIDFKDDKLIFRDSGKGIEKEKVDEIFKPLYTGDTSRTGDKLRGMGLANVKRICDIHGWTIAYKDGFIIKIKG